MDNPGSAALLGRRLDRLRVSVPAGRGLSGAIRPDHATALAAALGGDVVRGVVRVERVFELPVAFDALGTLPYPFEAGRPLVCLDLETTGLATAAGTLPFMVGLGVFADGRLTVRQYVLPDHADESALLDLLDDELHGDAWLVTYNGRTFDWPLLVARFRLHRRDPPLPAGHLDLLPVARQLWKHRLGDARLATVERAVCAVERNGDLPGALIPERYFEYLRSRRAELLCDVVEHNRQDIVSLGRLLTVLTGVMAVPDQWPQLHPGDLAGLARGYLRRRRPTDALRCVEAALDAEAWRAGLPGGAQLHRHLSAERARLLARLGRRPEAYAAWHDIAARGGPGAALAWLHVARQREHAERDIDGALEACRAAAAVAERARAWERPMLAIEADLLRRLPRLRRKSLAARRFSRVVARAA